ncbi:MAG: hypothetical protein R6W76_03910 [Caldilinea sp.]
MNELSLPQATMTDGYIEDSELRTASRPILATRQLTVEHLLYAVFVVVAILLRFVGLGAEPLSPPESAAAWSAWLAASHQVVAGSPAPTSALLYGLQSLLFWIMGGGDILARVFPALLGVATVLLPWFWREWVGRRTALVVAAIFAVDPWLMAWGRRSDSASLSIFLALLTLTALWHWGRQPDPVRALRWERTGAVALALLVASGPLAWGMAPVLIFFFVIYIWPDRRRSLHRSTLIWFGVVLALAVTGFALRAEAVAALSASLTAWLVDIGGMANTNPLTWPFLRLLIDLPLLVVFGPLGLVALWIRPLFTIPEAKRLAIFLTAWLAWGLLLWLLPGRPPAVLPIAGMPLAIAAATLIARVLERPWGDFTGLELFTLLAVQTVLVVAGSIWLAALVDSVVLNEQIWLTSGIIVALMVAVWIIFGVWAGWRSTGRVAIVFYTVLLGAMTVRSGWQLNHDSEYMQPAGFWPAVTSNEVRLLVQDVERLSSIRRGDPHQIDMQVVYDVSPDPVLGWHLREMRNLRHVRGVDATQFDASALPLIVAPASRNDSLMLPDPYIGSEYDTAYFWRPDMLPPQEGTPREDQNAQQRWSDEQRPLLRWLFYRKASEPPTTQSVTLWTPR